MTPEFVDSWKSTSYDTVKYLRVLAGITFLLLTIWLLETYLPFKRGTYSAGTGVLIECISAFTISCSTTLRRKLGLLSSLFIGLMFLSFAVADFLWLLLYYVWG